MGFTEITSERRKNVPLLNRYMCRICKKWKDTTCFANKETNGYKAKIAMGHKVDGKTALLRCRLCAGAQLHELECAGPCGTWKELHEFSKSARMAGGSGWCQACVLWKDSNESGIATAAPPAGVIAPDEDEAPFSHSHHVDNSHEYHSDPECGSSDDDYSFIPSANASEWGTAATDLAAAQYAAPFQQSGPSSTMARPSAPPSLVSRPSAPSLVVNRPSPGLATTPRPSAPQSTIAHPSGAASPNSLSERITTPTAAMSQMSLGSGPWSSQNSRPGAAHPLNNTSILPPHLRGHPSNASPANAGQRKASDTRTVSSASNPYEGTRTEATSQPSWSAIDARCRGQGPAGAPMIYNAWDANGVAHIQQRVLSSGTPSETGSTTTTTTAVRAPAPPATARNSNWAKPSGTRGRQVQYNPLDHQANPRRPVLDDSDDDDDADNM